MKKLLFAAAIAAASTPALAYDKNSILFGLGATDVIDDDRSAAVNVEWRGKKFDENAASMVNHLSPQIGLVTDTQSTIYVYAGAFYDWNFYERWSLVPQLALGLYRQGAGKDMGSGFEIRTALELNYKLTPESKVGVNFAHISNAGVADRNPGREDVFLNYSFAY